MINKIISLASSSSGNCYIYDFKATSIMVDVGITFKSIKEKCVINNIDLSKISKLFITHDHSDHVKGLNVFLKNNSHIKLYILKSTYDSIDTKYINSDNVVFLDVNEEYKFDGVTINLFETSHDANGSFGLIFNDNNKKFVHMTDSGYITKENLEKFNNCNGILIESNYEDEVIIENDRYPFMTKKRIMSNKGHLSNHQCNEYLKEIICEDTNIILYAHLSPNNNSDEIVSKYTNDFSCDQHILKKDEVVVINDIW